MRLTLCAVDDNGVDVAVLCSVELCCGGEACSAKTYYTTLADSRKEGVKICYLGSSDVLAYGHKSVTLDSYSRYFSTCGGGEGLDLGDLTGHGGIDGR